MATPHHAEHKQCDRSSNSRTMTTTNQVTLIRVPTLLLRKNSRTFSRMLYTVCALVNLLYTASSTVNILDKVHHTQRCNIQMYYIWNATHFKIYCHFVSVSKSPKLALCILVNLNHNQKFQNFPGPISFSWKFPGPGNFRKINQGLSMIFQDAWEP